MKRASTTSLQKERGIISKKLFDRIHNLPIENQIRILGQLEDDQLSNICLINTYFFNLCLDPFLREAKKWSQEDYWAFIIELDEQCADYEYKECDQISNILHDILNNLKFLEYYNLIINNSLIDNKRLKLSSDYHQKMRDVRSSPVRRGEVILPYQILYSTREIIFDDSFNLPINLKPFINLEKLTFGSKFNQYIDKTMIPQYILYLKFGDDYNQSSNNLPDSLTNIIFGKHFNQSVDNASFPKYVSVSFGDDFNQPVNKLSSISGVEFGTSFQQSIDNMPLVMDVKLAYSYKVKINKLPEYLDQITVSKLYPYLNELKVLTDDKDIKLYTY